MKEEGELCRKCRRRAIQLDGCARRSMQRREERKHFAEEKRNLSFSAARMIGEK